MKEYEFNPNNIKHCLERADALKALEERELTQVMQPNIGVWNDRRDDEQFDDFQKQFRYRRKPTPIARQWSKPSDVPGPVCWIRDGGKGAELLIVGIDEHGISASQGAGYTWAQTKSREYSTTREAGSWKPCTTLEP